jgi:rare lipoprotein A
MPCLPRARLTLGLAIAVAGLAACAGRRPPPVQEPVDAPAGWTQEGLASWYGPQFHGRPTASGEAFDQEAMTAAHPSLPLGTRIEVTVLETGRRTSLRVNDRGPFVDDRILDVSRGAARRLGFLEAGTARVRVRVVESPAACHEVQVGSFREEGNARAMRHRLREEGEPVRTEPGPGGFTRVVAGPYEERGEARAVRDRLGGSVRPCREEGAGDA